MKTSPNLLACSALVLAIAALSLGGCATTLPAPPTQTAPHDAPGTIGDGRTEVTAGGGTGSSLFNGSYPHGELSVRHGIDDRNDLTLRATAGRVTATNEEEDGRDVDAWRGIVGLRLGIAHDFVPGILMGFAGLGGGATGAGGYMGIDYGLSLGYDNRYFVPFLAGSMNLSAPLTRPTLDFTREDDTLPNLRRAYASFGFGLAVGFRVPFGGYRSDTPHTGAFTFTFDANTMYGSDPAAEEGSSGLEHLGYIGFYAGLSQTFGGPPTE